MAERINKQEPIWTSLIQSIKKILLIVTPLFILAFFLSPLVLRYFLGERWEQSALYIQIMIPWLIISLFTASLSSIPPIFGKQRIALIIEIIYIVARLISLIIGIYIQNFVWAIILFSFVSAVVLMAQLTWYLLLVKKYEQSLKTI